MKGKLLSYYYMHDDETGYLKISLGLVDNEGKWVFYSEDANIPDSVPEKAVDKMVSEYVAAFLAAKGKLFYAGKLAPNSDQYSHPIVNA